MKSTTSKLIATTAKSYKLDAAPTTAKPRQTTGAKAKTYASTGSMTVSHSEPCFPWNPHGFICPSVEHLFPRTGEKPKAKTGPKPAGRPRKTVSEMKTHATRVNKYDPITQKGMGFDAKQKLVRAAI